MPFRVHIAHMYLQKEQLLSNSDRLRRTGDMIEESYQITIESERVGMSVMDDLSRDREKILQSRRRVSWVVDEVVREICFNCTVHALLWDEQL